MTKKPYTPIAALNRKRSKIQPPSYIKEMKVDAYVVKGRTTEPVFKPELAVKLAPIGRNKRGPGGHAVDGIPYRSKVSAQPKRTVIIFFIQRDPPRRAYYYQLRLSHIRPPVDDKDTSSSGHSIKQLTYIYDKYIVPQIIQDTVRDRAFEAQMKEPPKYLRASNRFKRQSQDYVDKDMK